jgi:hypothetical protein
MISGTGARARNIFEVVDENRKGGKILFYTFILV